MPSGYRRRPRKLQAFRRGERLCNPCTARYPYAIPVFLVLLINPTTLSCDAYRKSSRGRMDQLRYCIADSSHFDTIHRLNYQTFVEEIPQHAPNPQRRLVDRFHHQNTYVICLAGDELVGMLSGRCERPFSLDQKVPELDRWLPAHRKAVEARLLTVACPYRNGPVFHGLLTHFCRVFMSMGCDLAVVSGTLRQLKLYRHLGFQFFAQPVGTPAAAYQPMWLSLARFLQLEAFGAVASR